MTRTRGPGWNQIPVEVATWLVERAWPTVERIVNSPEAPCRCRPRCPECVMTWGKLRADLDRLLEGKDARGGNHVSLVVGWRAGRAWWWADVGADDDHVPQGLGYVTTLLNVPALRRRLRRCAHCGAIRMRPEARTSRDRRFFCDKACSKAWEQTSDGRLERARRQKAFRASLFRPTKRRAT